MPPRIQVFIVDDHGLIIEGLKAALQQTDDISIVGFAQNAQNCLSFVQKQVPDVLLLDLHLPDMQGTELCSEILSLHPDLKIVVLSSSAHPFQVTQLMNMGAKGYLLKTTDPSEITVAIRQVHSGHMFICKEIGSLLFSKPSPKENRPNLTKRESEVLKLLADGLTAPEVAEKLHLSQLTVESHRRNIMAKLNAKNTAMLVRMAIDNNLI